MQAASKAPKYFGVYRTKRDLLSAVRAKNEADPNSHFFDRQTRQFFRSSKYFIEDSEDGPLLCVQNNPPSMSGHGTYSYVARYRLNADLSIGGTVQ